MHNVIVLVRELASLQRQGNFWCQGLMQLKELCHPIKR